jgi:DNA-directed RNA polymerase beta subunit
LNIINPVFKLQNENRNLFTFRRNDYDNIQDMARQIIEPALELGFMIEEFELRPSRFTSGELSRTIKETLVIRLKKSGSIIDLSMYIPKLIDENYLIINGRRKVPLFQLFDIPVVTRGETIKLRTNVATLMLFKSKEAPHINVSFLGKIIPLSLLLLAYYGPDETFRRFDLANVKSTIDINLPLYDVLLSEIKLFYEESKGETQDEFIQEVGKFYSKYNAKSKGQDVVYAIDLVKKVDVITARFLQKENILEELIWAMQQDFIDDTAFTNKRVRCFEYLIFSKLSKNIFDLCFSNRTSKQPSFNISTGQVLSDCNVSDIVQFDFSINPIEELTKLSRISILGPGGFKRENIPRHLRDICPTMYGRVCPVDTPDRDNCGVLQNLIPNVILDDNMKFTEDFLTNQPISIPVSFTPLLEHDDQTRLQMAASQMRQSILLKEFDEPYVKSGCEGLYTKHTQFIKIAKKDGEVIHRDPKFLIVAYDDGEVEVFDIGYRKIYIDHMDILEVYVSIGDKFKANDILAESNFSKNGQVVFGRNLLTGVMVYYGNNYEDGIIISDRLLKEETLCSVHFKDMSFIIPPNKVLLSLQDKIYKPLPDPEKQDAEIIETGNPYAILKTISLDDPHSVFVENMELRVEKPTIISEVNIFANEWCTQVEQYKEWVEQRVQHQIEKETELRAVIKEKLPKNEAQKVIREYGLDVFSHVGKFKEKGEKINGIKVEMYGIYFRPISVGDKMANRHGNKGVISRIVPHDKMPQLPDGRHLDICINPLGIISRMNIGQLYELHLGMAVYDLIKNAKQMIQDGKSQTDIRQYIIGFINIIDCTDGWYSDQFVEQLPTTIDEEFLNNLRVIQPPFESCKLDDIAKALEYTGTLFKYDIYDPISKNHLMNPVSVGYLYFFRMVHIAEEKLAARGIGSYAKRTLQPLGGRKNKGGQRCGEMETACIIGHDAPNNLFEFLTTKSDCIDLKKQHIRDFIDPSTSRETAQDLDIIPESVKLLNSYLTVIGVNHK